MSTEGAEPKNLVVQAEGDLREYQKSRAFTEDLLRAFAEATKQAQEENERLGLLPSEHRQQN